jgi:3-hydroxyacyl-[acyl-carrier-protein] dehydratase
MKFRMVDRILDWEPERRIRGVKTVSFEEYCLKEAFGGHPRLPETLLVESFFQLGNWLIILSTDFTRMGVVIRTGRIHFEGTLGPGEIMTMEVGVRSWREDGILFDGVAHVGPLRIVSGEGCLAVPVPLERFCDPGDLRILFGEIHRPAG